MRTHETSLRECSAMGQDRSSASSHQQVQRLAPPRKGRNNPVHGPRTKTCHGFGGNLAGDAVNHAGTGNLQQATEDDPIVCRVIHLLEGPWTKEGMEDPDIEDIDIVIAANIISPSSIDPSAQHSQSPQDEARKALGMRHPSPSDSQESWARTTGTIRMKTPPSEKPVLKLRTSVTSDAAPRNLRRPIRYSPT